MPFSCSRSDFLVLYHMIEQSAIMKRALIGYVSRIRGLYLRAGAYKMGEGFILEFYGTPSKIRKSAYKNSLDNMLGDPANFAVIPKGAGNKPTLDP